MTKFRLIEITRIENYFNQEINQRKLCIKKLRKYVTVFDYKDNILIALSATAGGVSIILFTSVVGAPVGIASASFTLFFLFNRNNQKITKHNKKNKRKFEECKWKTRKIETDQCEFKNNTEFVTDDFKWLKNVSLKKKKKSSETQAKLIKHLRHQKCLKRRNEWHYENRSSLWIF